MIKLPKTGQHDSSRHHVKLIYHSNIYIYGILSQEEMNDMQQTWGRLTLARTFLTGVTRT